MVEDEGSLENMKQEYHTRINWLDRTQIVEALEGVGIACFDSETTEDLREALRENVLDGTINPDTLS